MVNDLEATAVEAIKRNTEFNGLDPSVVVPHRGDAASLMYRHRNADGTPRPLRLSRSPTTAFDATSRHELSSFH